MTCWVDAGYGIFRFEELERAELTAARKKDFFNFFSCVCMACSCSSVASCRRTCVVYRQQQHRQRFSAHDEECCGVGPFVSFAAIYLIFHLLNLSTLRPCACRQVSYINHAPHERAPSSIWRMHSTTFVFLPLFHLFVTAAPVSMHHIAQVWYALTFFG